jgi:hypothetical protein
MHQDAAIRTRDFGKDSNDEASRTLTASVPIGKAGPYFSARKLESHIRAAHPKAPTTITAKYTFSIRTCLLSIPTDFRASITGLLDKYNAYSARTGIACSTLTSKSRGQPELLFGRSVKTQRWKLLAKAALRMPLSANHGRIDVKAVGFS